MELYYFTAFAKKASRITHTGGMLGLRGARFVATPTQAERLSKEYACACVQAGQLMVVACVTGGYPVNQIQASLAPMHAKNKIAGWPNHSNFE